MRRWLSKNFIFFVLPLFINSQEKVRNSYKKLLVA